jgi:hypothetical protein
LVLAPIPDLAGHRAGAFALLETGSDGGMWVTAFSIRGHEVDWDGPAVVSGRQSTITATQSPAARGNAAPPLVDYCRLAEECFFLAAVARDPALAAELVRAGDDYLQCAADSTPLAPVV